MEPNGLDLVFKALADPTRRAILDDLADRPDQSLFQICAGHLGRGGQVLTRQAVTQHLDMLERAGLIRICWVGRTKLHRADLAPLRAVAGGWLARMVGKAPEAQKGQGPGEEEG